MCVLLTDYSGQGVDQLQKIIDTIKSNPEDRRIIMCAWNPKGTGEKQHTCSALFQSLSEIVRTINTNCGLYGKYAASSSMFYNLQQCHILNTPTTPPRVRNEQKENKLLKYGIGADIFTGFMQFMQLLYTTFLYTGIL